MGSQRTCYDDIACPPVDHVRQHIVNVLYHDVDIQVQHSVNSPSIGIDQVPAHVRTRISMQDVELTRLLQYSRQQRGALPRVK